MNGLHFEALPPLSERRQQAMIQRAQEGDEHAMDLVVRHNARMVVKIANKYYGIREFDDVVADGLHGLAKAIMRFDASRGYKFSTYAWPYVNGYILDGLNKGRARETEAHLDKPMGHREGAEELTMLDTLVDPDPLPDEQAEQSVLRWEMVNALDKHLNPRTALIMKLYYGIGTDEQPLSQKEIAERIEVSPGRVHEIIKRAHTILRVALSDQKELLA